MENIILHSTNLKDFQTIIGDIVRYELKQFNPESRQLPNQEYGTRKEVSDRLKISLATLHSYTKNGILKGYRIGGRVLYKWSQIEEAVKQIETIKYRRSNL